MSSNDDQDHFASVWDAIKDTPAEAEFIKLRSSLMSGLQSRIRAASMTHGQAAKLFGVTQPRLYGLMRGKIDLFGIDTLVTMLATAGLHIEMRFVEPL